MIKNFGVMQGRLLKPINNKIQSFPYTEWIKEFKLVKGLNLKYLEWTLDDKKLEKSFVGHMMDKSIKARGKTASQLIQLRLFYAKTFWKKEG